MKYKNYQIKLLSDILACSFPAPQARSRNRFIKVLQERAEAIEKDRLEIITEFANKDKEGRPIIKDDNFDIPAGKMAEFNKQYAVLMNEEFEMKSDNSLKEEDIQVVKGLIKGTNREMNPQETAIYEELLTNSF